MKAITIWQPWASLLACGTKRYETRSWATSYRGPIAIHSAKKNVIDTTALFPVQVKDEMERHIETATGVPLNSLPTGAVIATAELVDVWRIVRNPCQVEGAHRIGAENQNGDYIIPSEMELALGDWTPGRYAWELANVKLVGPIPAKGKQGLWELKEEK